VRFLLVDRIEGVEPGERIRGWKNAALSEDYFEWHFPERPIVPGALVLEACVQLAGWLEAASSDFEHWMLLDRVVSARYYDFALPGDRIDLVIERAPLDAPDRRLYRAESRVRATRGAAIEFEGRLVPLDTLASRAAARRVYTTLTWGRP
jgi:3-hydroxyacyl-[acyl-carrier-protein] dehydratase